MISVRVARPSREACNGCRVSVTHATVLTESPMKQFSTSCITISALLGFASACSADMPYAGQQSRTIKALSDQEVADYVEGRGMGSSKAAELNHYPGPMHVIADSSRLGLTEKQKIEAQSVFDAMSTAAKS